MTCHDHPEERWMSCVLCRSERQGLKTLQKAMERKIKWPEPKHYRGSPIQDPAVYTTIDDAFSCVLQFMSTASRQCKRYYKSSPTASHNTHDCLHCSRFHTKKYSEVQRKNPLQLAEDVHVVVAPGTYAVTAGSWGTPRQQTHVVHVNQGQSVDLNFVM
ncbi:A-kinase-interacting protein 1-like [Ptychodera flava]|uniref:A-kinase-interacting protein 1-like n=1 Tax=Ptychodera flava TaxID=63121 RepID=UPI00396A6982